MLPLTEAGPEDRDGGKLKASALRLLEEMDWKPLVKMSKLSYKANTYLLKCKTISLYASTCVYLYKYLYRVLWIPFEKWRPSFAVYGWLYWAHVPKAMTLLPCQRCMGVSARRWPCSLIPPLLTVGGLFSRPNVLVTCAEPRVFQSCCRVCQLFKRQKETVTSSAAREIPA